MEKESLALHEQAKELVQKQLKTRALLVLKLKKHKEKAVESVEAQLFSVLQMAEDLEWESTNMEVLRALKSGTAQLNALHEEMSADDVAALLEETNEAIEVWNIDLFFLYCWGLTHLILTSLILFGKDGKSNQQFADRPIG